MLWNIMECIYSWITFSKLYRFRLVLQYELKIDSPIQIVLLPPNLFYVDNISTHLP